ncbi:MAG: tetratricopeptide repeat protein, partial [Planctomycetaceae bacterium]|nr:tetratricopeptide repeat protein [Planctomycetaceae bacterium]
MRTLRFLAAVVVVWTGYQVSIAAQNAPPSPAPAKTGVNPEHERLKSDAENAYQNGEFPKAIELTTRVLTQSPKDHVALYLRASSRVELGQMRRDLKDVRGGIEDAREAMRHGGTDQINYYLPYFYGMSTLAQMENRKEHADVVVTFASQILVRTNIKPDDRANLLYQRAAAYLFQRNLEAASKDYEAAIKLVPGHVGARLGLADCFIQMKKLDQAEAAFTSAAEAVPNNPLVFNNRGMFYQQQGKTQNAIADFSRAIELDAEYAVAYTNRGFASMAEGNLVAAENDFSSALKLDPAQPLVYSLRGTARLSQGNAKAAMEDYTQVLQIDSKNPIAHVDLGFAKYFAGDFPGAAAAFDQAVTIEANLRYVLPWRYWALIKAGQGGVAET